jgi:hypothetical protein
LCFEKLLVLIFWGVYVCRIQIETCTDIQRSEMMQPIIFTILASASTYAISWETFGLKGGRRLQADTTTVAPSETATTAASDATTVASDVTTVASGDMSTTAAADSSTTVAGAVGNETTTVAPGNETTVAGAVGNETTTIAPSNETTMAVGNETTTVAPSTNITIANITIVVVNATGAGDNTTVVVSENGTVSVPLDFASFASAHLLNNIVDPTCNSSCCQCVANQSALALMNATEVIQNACASSENQGTLAVCDFLYSQPKEAIGMVMGYADIVQQSNAFCIGSGACPLPFYTTQNICPANPLFATNIDDTGVAAFVQQASASGVQGLGLSYTQCLLNTAFYIMDKVTALDNVSCAAVVSAAGNSSSSNETSSGDPCQTYQTASCAWRASNPDIYWGLRYSTVEPMKFARGFCIPISDPQQY